MRLVVAVTGASGVIYGARFLEVCKSLGIETELVVSKPAEILLEHELGKRPRDLEVLATRSYAPEDLGAPIASGSYAIDGMVIVPCSTGTLGALASGVSKDLIARTADVSLKQGRPLVLVIRETPLNLVHLENMAKLKRAGAVILPASPAFYHKPERVKDLVDFVIGRILEIFKIKHQLYRGWGAGTN
jgi:4-hydroxy-3-polyprenylbenzoate decarboxylase